MDQVRPLMREQRSHDCASLDWPTGPHPTPSGSGLAPTADRSKTPAAGSRSRGIDSTGPVTEGWAKAHCACPPSIQARYLNGGHASRTFAHPTNSHHVSCRRCALRTYIARSASSSAWPASACGPRMRDTRGGSCSNGVAAKDETKPVDRLLQRRRLGPGVGLARDSTTAARTRRRRAGRSHPRRVHG